VALIENALYAYLSAHSGLFALVNNRIYPNDLPKQPTYPAVVYELVEGDAYLAMGARPGISFSIYRFTCYATTKSAAVAVAKQVKAALDYYSGTMGAGANQTTVEWAKWEREYDEDPPSLLASIGEPARAQYGRVVEILINFRE
jgi:hypothetical protein